MSFKRKTGNTGYNEYPSAGTIAAGDAVQFDENGEVIVAASGAEVLGIAVNAATSSTLCLVDELVPSDEVEALIETGTMAATEIGEEADINSADGLTLTESNNDFLITKWDGLSTDKCIGVFKNLVRG